MIHLLFAFSFLFASVPALAGEVVRIILIQDSPGVLFTSTEGFFVHRKSGAPLYLRPVLSATIGIKRGLTVNRFDSLEDELTFLPKEGGKISVERRPYAGIVRVKKKKGGLWVINEVDVEEYLKGVVPAEMASDWELEALKVQAIISRTYALYQKEEHRRRDFDLMSTVLSQVYQGGEVEDSRASLAIAETAGMVLTYGGRTALTFFHSTSAGPTEDAEERWNINLPYLKGVNCPLDRDSPYYQWKRTISLREMETAIRRLNHSVATVTLLAPLQWSRAGRILTLKVLHSEGEMVLKAEDLRAALGYKFLPSTRFTIDSFGTEIQISGMGYGHGVGLCQWGAKVMAEQGLKAGEILLYYYPGVTLQSYKEIKSFLKSN